MIEYTHSKMINKSKKETVNLMEEGDYLEFVNTGYRSWAGTKNEFENNYQEEKKKIVSKQMDSMSSIYEKFKTLTEDQRKRTLKYLNRLYS